jgi:hypothetical protein
MNNEELRNNRSPKYIIDVWIEMFNDEEATENTQELFNRYWTGQISVYDYLDGFEETRNVRINWEKISTSSSVDEEFAHRYAQKLCWLQMFGNPCVQFSKEFIQDNVWRINTEHKHISLVTEKLIERIGFELPESWYSYMWNFLSMRQDLSIPFIEKYQHKLNWKFLSVGRLSDNYIVRFAHLLQGHISSYTITEAVKRCRKSTEAVHKKAIVLYDSHKFDL